MRASPKMMESDLRRLAEYLEKSRMADYVNLLHNTRRLIFVNFISGLARGLGMAIGFSILGAVVIYFFSHSFVVNLPIVGEFIAEIVEIVQMQLVR